MNEIADDRMKYQSIEFCLDIMAADGIADEGELEAVRKISESLGLDFDEVQKLKDLRLKDLKMSICVPAKVNIRRQHVCSRHDDLYNVHTCIRRSQDNHLKYIPVQFIS